MLTKKQRGELVVLRYFALKHIDYGNLVNEHIVYSEIEVNDGNDSAEKCYFQITDSGIKKVFTKNKAELLKLLDAQKWRLRMCELYEQGILDGSMPYYVILGFMDENPVPIEVAKFIATTVFKGKDKQYIMNFYNKCIT